MASERQIAANRRNALLSSGPRTQAGKRASSRNSLSHGLSATENNDNLDGEIELSRLHPKNAAERRLAQSVAGDHARLNKARSLRSSAAVLADAADPHSIHLLSRYERASWHSMRKNLRRFNEMQITRTHHRARPNCSASDLPDQNGFEFAGMTKSPPDRSRANHCVHKVYTSVVGRQDVGFCH